MRRIGSNIRKQNSDAKANRIVRNIIKYTDAERPRNEYPKRIVSPVSASSCCRDENREMVGSAREIDGFKFCYKICTECGHAALTWTGQCSGPYLASGFWESCSAVC